MIVARELEQAQSEQPDVGQPQPAGTMQARLFNEVLDTTHQMETELWQLREFKFAAIEFVIEQGHAQDDEEAEQIITEHTSTRELPPREAALQRENQELREIAEFERRRRTHIWDEHQGFKEWIITLYHNKTIPVACKIVLLLFHILFHGRTNAEEHITMKELANVTGYDEGTCRKACDKLSLWDIIARRYEDLILEDGTKYSKGMVYFTLFPVVSTPEYIKMENRHGGDRERKCSNPDCRSTALDNYTVRHCRDCKESAWYGQPGLANDADLKAAQIGHIVAQNRRNGNNQDAFSPSELPNRINTAITVVDSQLVETQTTNVPQLPGQGEITKPEPETPQQDEQTVIQNCTSGNNQDAFSQQLGQEPLCDICHEHEAKGTLYQHGEPYLNYCKACEQTAHPQLDAQRNTPPLYGNLQGAWL